MQQAATRQVEVLQQQPQQSQGLVAADALDQADCEHQPIAPEHQLIGLVLERTIQTWQACVYSAFPLHKAVCSGKTLLVRSRAVFSTSLDFIEVQLETDDES